MKNRALAGKINEVDTKRTGWSVSYTDHPHPVHAGPAFGSPSRDSPECGTFYLFNELRGRWTKHPQLWTLNVIVRLLWRCTKHSSTVIEHRQEEFPFFYANYQSSMIILH